MSVQWTDLLSAEDRATMERARFGRRIGLGEHPAVLVIDVQTYMVGRPGSALDAYPSACPSARAALAPLARLLAAARAAGAPVIYTVFTLRRDGGDIGVYGRKRDLLTIDGWCLEGTPGAAIVPEVAPQPGDIVLPKKKPSAFFGTPLLSLLIDRGVDTILVTGGSTSNCVRATVVDSASYNFRTAVAADCVFDRFAISHRVALFDMDRQYADVLESATAVSHLEGLKERSTGR